MRVKCVICGESYFKTKCVVCGNIFLAEDKSQIRCWRCQKCLICGKPYDVLSEHLKAHGLTRTEYLVEFYQELAKGVLEPKRYGYVTKNCVGCGKPFRVKNCVVYEQIRCRKCQFLYVQRYKKLYNKRKKQTLTFYVNEFVHAYDKTTNLTVENGRIKGFLWLKREMKKHGKHRIQHYKLESFLQENHSFILIDNYTPYCAECGGKILKAFENERYSVREYACSVCGLVLEA